MNFNDFPTESNPETFFSSPPIFPPIDSLPSRPRIHLTMRCQARRGRRRGGALSQVQDPGPLQRSPSGRGAGTRGWRSDAAKPGYPDRKGVPQRHTDKAPMLSRTSRQRGEQNGGDGRQAANGQTIIPRARVPGRYGAPSGGNLPGHRPGYGRHSARRTLPQPDPRPVIPGTQVPRTVAALPERRMQRDKNAERGAGRSHILYLDRLLLAPRPRQV
jgi:hypothetical protein